MSLGREYDEWRTRNREDQEDMDEAKRQREEYLAERADDMRDRLKDEPREYPDHPLEDEC